jgi:hypothetical protein
MAVNAPQAEPGASWAAADWNADALLYVSRADLTVFSV